jgi:hypothetical protein
LGCRVYVCCRYVAHWSLSLSTIFVFIPHMFMYCLIEA